MLRSRRYTCTDRRYVPGRGGWTARESSTTATGPAQHQVGAGGVRDGREFEVGVRGETAPHLTRSIVCEIQLEPTAIPAARHDTEPRVVEGDRLTVRREPLGVLVVVGWPDVP